VQVVPDDPEYALEEHIAYKRKQEAINVQLKRLVHDGLSDFKLIMDGTAFAFTKLSLPNKGIVSVTDIITEYPHLRQLDLSTNQISDITHIQKLRFVTHLNLSRNCIA
jgi:Leucine-rich repeat (LRR) protein